MYSFFSLLNHLDLLRVGLEEEAMGLDASAMGTQDSSDQDVSATKVRERDGVRVLLAWGGGEQCYRGGSSTLAGELEGMSRVVPQGSAT